LSVAAAQARLVCTLLVAVAVSPVGAVGGVVSGAVGGEFAAELGTLGPPQPANAKASTGKSTSILMRNIATLIVSLPAADIPIEPVFMRLS
jgi:hypothetical protein